MQLSKSFSYHDHSIFADNLLRQQSSLDTHSSPNQEERVKHAHQSQQQDDNKIEQINQTQFYHQFKKIYSVSYHLYVEKQRLAGIYQKLNGKIITLEQRMKNSIEKEIKKTQNSSQQNRAKRSRRTDQMIEKRFKCNVQFCQRLYGSQGSLQQHIKLKHPQLYCSMERLLKLEEEYPSQ